MTTYTCWFQFRRRLVYRLHGISEREEQPDDIRQVRKPEVWVRQQGILVVDSSWIILKDGYGPS